jgi:RNA polymerase sigma-70 factor (ECF subfamily)
MSTTSSVVSYSDLLKGSESTGEVASHEVDAVLAAKASEGSLDAMETLVNRHHDRIFRFLVSKTQNRSDAEDLTQETFLKACRNIHQYNPKHPFTAWLYTIAQRSATSAWRKQRLTTHEIPEVSDEQSAPDQNLQTHELRNNLWVQAREILNHNQYSAIWLHYVEELTLTEIASALRKTVPGVKLLLFRARKKLTTHLSPSSLQS